MSHTFAGTRRRSVALFTSVMTLSLGLVSAAGCGGARAPDTGPVSGEPPNQLTRAERAAGWRLLFDGRSFAGWRGLGYSGVPAGHWLIEDGAIRKVATSKVPVGADGRRPPGGDLMTVATYRDFELEWDWRISEGGNSGVKYNVSEELSGGQPSNVLRPATGTAGVSHSAIGFEYQMIDDDRHPDGKLLTHRTGALYDLFQPSAARHVNPVGTWNHSRVLVRGNHGEHWLNGVKVVEYELGTPAFDSAFAASKFRSMSWFPQHRAGHVVLQDHGDDVWIRSLKIRELK